MSNNFDNMDTTGMMAAAQALLKLFSDQLANPGHFEFSALNNGLLHSLLLDDLLEANSE
jgi:hypothetical protein